MDKKTATSNVPVNIKRVPAKDFPRRCKKCGGNLVPDFDNELTCLQCGATIERSTLSIR
jgi:predicted RNA-binding Zn-ribbon protein involved in translation (DUF1610 family)